MAGDCDDWDGMYRVCAVNRDLLVFGSDNIELRDKLPPACLKALALRFFEYAKDEWNADYLLEVIVGYSPNPDDAARREDMYARLALYMIDRIDEEHDGEYSLDTPLGRMRFWKEPFILDSKAQSSIR